MPQSLTRPLSLSERTLRVPQAELHVVSGPLKGRVVPLGMGPLLIGRGAHCGLVLDDDTISAEHCEVGRRGDAIVISDRGSTNGVKVNGVAVLEAFAEPGAKIQLGSVELLLKGKGTTDFPLAKGSSFGPLMGHAATMRLLFHQLEAVAGSTAAVLIDGETGTGKDLCAQAIHDASERRDGPFVVFDCSATNAQLVESELFGHEAGAFTGAAKQRIGLAESANGGTLVLDEIGELSLELQPKLLRLLERQELRRVGGDEVIRVDVRFIACTHRPLRQAVDEKTFREDLFYRLSALQVRIPALRERPEDISLLVNELLAQHRSTQKFTDLPVGDQELLSSHQWPGNVRELRNVVERLVTFPDQGAASLLGITDVPSLAPGQLMSLTAARSQAQNLFERRYLETLMKNADGSISEGARLAGVSRQFLQRILRKHGLR